MPPHRTPTTTTTTATAAAPTRHTLDPYNSSTTGHQRSDNRLAGSTSWRASRSAKLGHQFRGGAGGGKRVSDSVGAGSREFGRDGRKEDGGWEVGAPGLRERGWQDVRGLLLGAEGGREGKGSVTMAAAAAAAAVRVTGRREGEEERARCANVEAKNGNGEVENDNEKKSRKIFDGLCVYINGSTAPLVGDHKLKYLLAEHGARVSIALGRRSVTHVVLGTPNGRAVGNGAGGGLAAGKIQKETARVGGCGVKYVGVEWVLESIKAGKRLPEAPFATMRIAAKGQKSVYGMFKRTESGVDGKAVESAATVQSTKSS